MVGIHRSQFTKHFQRCSKNLLYWTIKRRNRRGRLHSSTTTSIDHSSEIVNRNYSQQTNIDDHNIELEMVNENTSVTHQTFNDTFLFNFCLLIFTGISLIILKKLNH
ncbi:unnamed protein product [Adineta steineri]|uniref:Uncharacterized protein n=1 Tax=Adineta steineri TaxID=433720 RepID=A0A815HBN1_9BILA|nr:unnamed protein product [Adineta steineri]